MRYLPLTDADRRDMLARIGAPIGRRSVRATCPPSARLPPSSPTCRDHQGELEVERALRGLCGEEPVAAGAVPFFIGAGAYRHHVPATVDHLIQRGEFLTSYTPYQPEIAQGTLQYLFEFQTQVALLTGMEVANASMYDGSTGARRGGADGQPRHRAAARRCSRAGCIRTIASVIETTARWHGDQRRCAGAPTPQAPRI